MPNDWEEVMGIQNPAWNYKKDKEIQGTYKGMQTNVGPNNSSMYDIETKDGVIGVWGNAVLNTRMKNIEPGEEVKIVYGGLLKSEKTGRSYHSFSVYHRKQG